ncbi:MAG: tyrosine-type recombinase/integrase [Dehalococcoidia bacterium]|jgi:site-specific recombinase XerD|nr:tyrosine-type recombinase/integrase [Dehalococcoidia bacterium]
MTTLRPLDIRRALVSFDLALRAENKSPGTVGLYSLAVRQLIAYLEGEGGSSQVGDITRDEINGYLSGLHEQFKPSTVHTRYRGLQAFFKFLKQEGEIQESPMRNMRPPRLPEVLVPVLSEDDIKSLLNSCVGSSFEERRDLALIRLFVSTGARRGELINLRYKPEVPEENDISLDPPSVRVIGKGNRERIVPFDTRTAQAIDRYLRLREVHNHAYMPWLWLARKGRLSPTGVLQMIRRRARLAGLGRVNVHQLRHTFAHHWLSDGGNESDLMQLAGWRSRTMIDRYARSAAGERAAAATKRYGLGNRI